jgi:hypothetical protein
MPQQVPMPQGTLGQVVDQSQQQGPPPDAGGAMSDYAEAIQAAQRVYAPAMRQPLPPESAPGALANILSFGMMGLAHHDYAAAYNAKVEQQNALVRAKIADTAIDLVQKKQEIAALGGKQNMAMLGLQMRLLGLENQAQATQLAEAHRQWQRDRGNTMPPVLSQEGQAGLDELGLGQEPQPGMGGRVRLVPRPGGGWAAPGAGSPMAQALGGDQAAPQSGGGFAGLAERQAARKRQEEAAALEQKPLEAEDRKQISSMLRMRQLTQRALSEFSPAERAKFVGLANQPLNRIAQLVKGDPRFQQWSALVGQMQTLRFELAGAALTKTESEVLDSFVPTGREWGSGEEFDLKAKEFYGSSLNAIKARLQASKGRGTFEEEISKEPTQMPPPDPGTPGAGVPPSAGEGRKTRRLSSGKLIFEE